MAIKLKCDHVKRVRQAQEKKGHSVAEPTKDKTVCQLQSQPNDLLKSTPMVHCISRLFHSANTWLNNLVTVTSL